MSDVRALLRQERAVREQAARPTRRPAAAPAAAPTAKKRKAADDSIEDRKRNKTETSKVLPAGFFDDGAHTGEEGSISESMSPPPSTAPVSAVQEPAAPQNPPPVELDESDEAALAAFEREIAAVPAPRADAIVEAAPMTVQEIAAQDREDRKSHMRRMEEDDAADEEDFQNRLQDEFEIMDGLEERARKLREKREALRQFAAQVPTQLVVPMGPDVAQAEQDEESDSDEDDSWDIWRFRRA
jgi:hypothetical protein